MFSLPSLTFFQFILNLRKNQEEKWWDTSLLFSSLIFCHNNSKSIDSRPCCCQFQIHIKVWIIIRKNYSNNLCQDGAAGDLFFSWYSFSLAAINQIWVFERSLWLIADHYKGRSWVWVVVVCSVSVVSMPSIYLVSRMVNSSITVFIECGGELFI